MFQFESAFSGFSVNDLGQAKEFYSKVLGLNVKEDFMADGQPMGIHFEVPGVETVFVYAKENHQPATFTILNFRVTDIDAAVDQLAQAGVTFEHYEGMHQDEKGIARGLEYGMGPSIAWFTDPSGNILSVVQDTKN